MDLDRFMALHRGQAKAWKIVQRSLMTRMERERAEMGDAWFAPEDMRAELTQISKFLSESSSAMVKIHESATKAYADMTTEAIEAQLKDELVRSCRAFTDDDWNLVDKIRAERDAAIARAKARGELRE